MREMHYQPKILDQRPCDGCGTVFVPDRPWQRFHTDACRNKWHAENPNTPNPLEKDEEFQLSLMNPNPSFRARKDADHYFVDFELSKEEWEYFTDPNIDRTGMVLEMVGTVTHRAQKKITGSSNGRISGFDPDDAGSTPAPVAKPKGGPLSQEAAKMCKEPLFEKFLMAEYPTYLNYWSRVGYSTDPIISTFRDLVGVHSRSEIDHNETAKRIFMDLMKEYNAWAQKNGSP
jgi:hypothetical protein